jgi:biotin operon repressor
MSDAPLPTLTDAMGGYSQVAHAVILTYGAKLGAYGLATYLALKAHANSQTGQCNPSQSRIAELLGCSRQRVNEALRALRELGLIAEVAPAAGKTVAWSLPVVLGDTLVPPVVLGDTTCRPGRQVPVVLDDTNKKNKNKKKEQEVSTGSQTPTESSTPASPRAESDLQRMIRMVMFGVAAEKLTRDEGKFCGYVAGYCKQLSDALGDPVTAGEVLRFAEHRRANGWRVTWMAFRDYFGDFVREHRGLVGDPVAAGPISDARVVTEEDFL